MTYCVYCITEIGPENPVPVGCEDEDHFAHQDCHEPMKALGEWTCPACADPDAFASEVNNAMAGGTGGYGAAPADVGRPAAVAVVDPPAMAAVADPPAMAAVADPPAMAAVAVDPAEELAARYATGAVRLTAAISVAQAAYEAADAAIRLLTDAGVDRQKVVSTLAKMEQHYPAALDACARFGDYLAWGDFASWVPDEGTLGTMDEASASFEGYAPVLARAQPVLAAMRVVDVGDAARLGNPTAQHNVADAALGGEGFQGTNSHPLTGNLKGWISIREEGPNVILIRWAGDRWEVGATGHHVSKKGSGGYDYDLDDGISTSYETTLAWKPLGGKPALA